MIEQSDPTYDIIIRGMVMLFGGVAFIMREHPFLELTLRS